MSASSICRHKKTSRVSLQSAANHMWLAQFVCMPQFFKTPSGLCGHYIYFFTSFNSKFCHTFGSVPYFNFTSALLQLHASFQSSVSSDFTYHSLSSYYNNSVTWLWTVRWWCIIWYVQKFSFPLCDIISCIIYKFGFHLLGDVQ
jgi:hypothetical protein